MDKFSVELGKRIKRIIAATKKKYPEVSKVTVNHVVHPEGTHNTQVVCWDDNTNIIRYNFDLTGTTKQVIQKINAGALTE